MNTPGYGTLQNSSDMVDIARDAAEFFPNISFSYSDIFSSGSTDMGDLSAIMPVVHPYAPGATGISHGADYQIANPELACVTSAKWQLIMLTLLLKDGAVRAKKVIENFKPAFASREEYLGFIDGISCKGDRIIYTDGEAKVKL